MSVVEMATELARRRELKTLVIDLERLPGKAEVPFWSLSDYKNRRIRHDLVTEWPRTISGAWRWFGQKKIHFAAEWETDPGDFAARLREAIHQADIVTGHNVNRFDRKHWNTLFRDHGIPMPSPYKVVDTLVVGRRELGDESMTLDALCQRYGIPTKQGRYDADVARDACAGVKRAQSLLKTYNMADVEASTGLYAMMLPLIKGHPHVAPVRGLSATTCPRCGSDQVRRDGTYSPAVIVYQAYLCTSCTSYFRTTWESRGPSVRAL